MPKHSPYSTVEKQLWADRAALLDPAAYVFYNGVTNGPSFVVGPVPAGKQWYVLNHWGVLSSINSTITGTVVNGSNVFTSAALTGTEGGLYVNGTGVGARYLLEASAGAGVLSGNASAPATDASYQLYSTTYGRLLFADIDSAVQMPAADTMTISPGGGYVYVCQPELVIPAPYGSGTDQRYKTNPKGLYFDRLAALRSMTLHRLDVVVPPSTPINTVTTKDFPTDFDDALLVHVNCHDSAWVGLNSPTVGAMNVMIEISDYHMVRFAQRVLAPFRRTTFPNFRVAGANIPGNNQASYGSGYGGSSNPFAGQGGCSYFKLPAGW